MQVVLGFIKIAWAAGVQQSRRQNRRAISINAKQKESEDIAEQVKSQASITSVSRLYRLLLYEGEYSSHIQYNLIKWQMCKEGSIAREKLEQDGRLHANLPLCKGEVALKEKFEGARPFRWVSISDGVLALGKTARISMTWQMQDSFYSDKTRIRCCGTWMMDVIRHMRTNLSLWTDL